MARGCGCGAPHKFKRGHVRQEKCLFLSSCPARGVVTAKRQHAAAARLIAMCICDKVPHAHCPSTTYIGGTVCPGAHHGWLPRHIKASPASSETKILYKTAGLPNMAAARCAKSPEAAAAPSDPVMNGPHQMQPLQTSTTVENFAC
jgi:hypothetical protein